MSLLFEEIDSQTTPIGEISLRRRRLPAFGDRDIYEVKLGDEFLMSSLFVDAEIALADLGLAAVKGDSLSVVVGGLGLGYTAEAALKDARISELLVVEALDTVIHWHQTEQVPLGKALNADARCRYVHGSFFDLAVNDTGFDPAQPGRLFDAILLDIDHSPRALLHDSNASFYTAESLNRMANQLRDGGVFALWSNELPDDDFMTVLDSVLTDTAAHIVYFDNPLQGGQSSNTVYVGIKK
ncbi:MAG TPA: spermidine synthase [Pseudomonadales bacterium]